MLKMSCCHTITSCNSCFYAKQTMHEFGWEYPTEGFKYQFDTGSANLYNMVLRFRAIN